MLKYSEIKPVPKAKEPEVVIVPKKIEPVVVKAKAPVREESDEEYCAAPSGRPEWPIGSAVISNHVL